MNTRLITNLTSIFLGSTLMAAAEKQKPNVILMMLDDVGIEAFNTYGGTDYPTPNINKLAKNGMQFNHCYSQPLCTPSRVKIMTGQSNVRNYYDFSLLHPNSRTFGHMMQEAGYQTGLTGKWQLYGAANYGETAGKGMHPKNAGFHSYRLWQVSQTGSRFDNPKIEENGKMLNGEGKYGPTMFCDFAVDFIEQNKQKPFFLYYPLVLVHAPFVPTPDSKSNKQTKKENFRDMMSYTDKVVGRVVAALEKHQLSENTLLILTADNGTHGSLTSSWKGQQIKGGKGLPTDAGTHVPLYAYWPKSITANTTSNSLIDFADFYPTLRELANSKDETKVDGNSFLPRLLGKEKDSTEPIYVYSNARPTREDFSFSVFARNQTHKLYKDGRFYHVTKDRNEEHDIKPGSKGDSPEIRKQLQQKLDSMPKEGQNIIKGAVRK